MGLNVIAEGVETKEQQEFLELRGCHAFQGYFFGKPMPIDQFEKLLGRASILDEQRQGSNVTYINQGRK
jgi:EAL domain-containing protein (putative c-di-GMP-specific phosphodiesterase class I)